MYFGEAVIMMNIPLCTLCTYSRHEVSEFQEHTVTLVANCEFMHLVLYTYRSLLYFVALYFLYLLTLMNYTEVRLSK
jgi:hypothetical protein